MQCTTFQYTLLTIIYSRARNRRQSIVMKPSFENPVPWMGSDSFVDTNIFVKKYYNLLMFSDFLNQNLSKCRPQKGNLFKIFLQLKIFKHSIKRLYSVIMLYLKIIRLPLKLHPVRVTLHDGSEVIFPVYGFRLLSFS